MPHIVLADANNKRKETKQAGIFSLQNVCCSRVTEGRTAVAGFLVRTQERAGEGGRPAALAGRLLPDGGGGQPPGRQGLATKLEMERGGQKEGLSPHGFLNRVKLKTLVSFLRCFPFHMALLSMLVFS